MDIKFWYFDTKWRCKVTETFIKPYQTTVNCDIRPVSNQQLHNLMFLTETSQMKWSVFTLSDIRRVKPRMNALYKTTNDSFTRLLRFQEF